MALDVGAAVMMTSQLGRPTEGEFKPADALAPVAQRLGELMDRDVPLLSNLAKPDLLDHAKAVINSMKARGAAMPIPTDVVTAKTFSAYALGHRQGSLRDGR